MSRTLKAIERHMTQPSESKVVERSAPKLVGRMATARTGNVIRTHAKKIAVGFRAFAINQTRNS